MLEQVLQSFANALSPREEEEAGRQRHGRRDLSTMLREAKENVLKTMLDCTQTGQQRESERCWRDRLGDSLELAKRLSNQIKEALQENLSEYDAVLDLTFYLTSPGLTGTGAGLFKAIFEVGLEFDRILGLPYYPASTLKGALRSFIRDLAKAKGLDGDRIVEALFGKTGKDGHMGYITFFDAYPVGCYAGSGHPCLVYTGAVITPHYYKEGKPVEAELDAQPNPVVHIAIAPGTVFRVLAGIRCPKGSESEVEALARSLGIEHLQLNCESKSGIETLASLIGALLATALNRGFAARSGKGYNILELKDIDLDDPRQLMTSVVHLRVYTSPSQHRAPRPEQRGAPRQNRSSARGERRQSSRGSRYGKRGKREGT